MQSDVVWGRETVFSALADVIALLPECNGAETCESFTERTAAMVGATPSILSFGGFLDA